MTTMRVWRCPDCDTLYKEPTDDPRYECPGCGSTFLKSESDSGNHRSPCCGRFSRKLGDHGCPGGCDAVLEEIEVDVDELTDEQKGELELETENGDDEDF